MSLTPRKATQESTNPHTATTLYLALIISRTIVFKGFHRVLSSHSLIEIAHAPYLPKGWQQLK